MIQPAVVIHEAVAAGGQISRYRQHHVKAMVIGHQAHGGIVLIIGEDICQIRRGDLTHFVCHDQHVASGSLIGIGSHSTFGNVAVIQFSLRPLRRDGESGAILNTHHLQGDLSGSLRRIDISGILRSVIATGQILVKIGVRHTGIHHFQQSAVAGDTLAFRVQEGKIVHGARFIQDAVADHGLIRQRIQHQLRVMPVGDQLRALIIVIFGKHVRQCGGGQVVTAFLGGQHHGAAGVCLCHHQQITFFVIIRIQLHSSPVRGRQKAQAVIQQHFLQLDGFCQACGSGEAKQQSQHEGDQFLHE